MSVMNDIERLYFHARENYIEPTTLKISCDLWDKLCMEIKPMLIMFNPGNKIVKFMGMDVEIVYCKDDFLLVK